MCSDYNGFSTEDHYTRKMQNETFPMDEHNSQPVWIEENAYGGYASPFREERNPIHAHGMHAELYEKDGEWFLDLDVPEALAGASCAPVSTERLGKPIYTEEAYENPDGTPIDFSVDLLGNKRTASVIPGPFASLAAGKQTIKVWKR